MKFICIIGLIFLNVVLSSVFINKIEVFGAVPNISIGIIGVYCLLEKDRKKAFAAGLLSGLFQDVFLSEVFGLYIFLMGFTGVLFGILKNIFRRENLFSLFFMIFIVSFIYGSMVLLGEKVSGGKVSEWAYIIRKIIPESLYSAVFAVPLYIFIKNIFEGIDDLYMRKKRFRFR